ncbi:MAG: lysostaphin resistance A-like protein [Acutalibacteraceae bacterium]
MNYYSGLFTEHRRQMEEQGLKRTLSVCAVLCIVSAILSYVLSIAYYIFFNDGGADRYGNYTPVYCIRYFLFIGLISVISTALPFVCASHTLGGMDKLYPLRRTKPLYTLSMIFIGIGACMVFQNLSGFWDKALRFFGYTVNQTIPYCNNGIVTILLFLMFAVVPALVEEFVYRGAILHALKDYGTGMAIIISAVLFGLGHFSLSTTPFAFLSGLVFGFITIKSQSLVPAVLIHITNNTYAIIYNVFCTKSTAEIIFMVNTVIPYLFILLGLIAFTIFVCKDRNFLRFEKSSMILSDKEKTHIVLSNGGLLAFVLLFLLLMIIPLLNIG